MSSASSVRPLRVTLRSYGRSLAGALLFALPAVYTMEIWWRGYNPDVWRLATLLVSGFLLLCLFEFYTGMHGNGREGLADAVGEACEGLFIGFVVTVAALWLLDVLPEISSVREWIGKVISEGVAVAVGVAIGDSQLGRKDDDDENDEKTNTLKGSHHATLHQFAFSVMGAVVLAAAIAPTEEIVNLAYGLSPIRQLIVLLVSFSICLTIITMVDFRNAHIHENYTGGVFGAALVTFLGAILTAVVLLLTNGMLLDGHLSVIVARIVVVGLPASVGAAAGKALIS